MQQLQAPQGSRRPAAGRLGQLEEELLDRVVDVSWRRMVCRRDRLDRPAFGELLKQLFFLGRQVRPLAGRPHERLDDSRIEHRTAAGHRADGAEQLVPFRDPILQEVGVAGRALTEK